MARRARPIKTKGQATSLRAGIHAAKDTIAFGWGRPMFLSFAAFVGYRHELESWKKRQYQERSRADHLQRQLRAIVSSPRERNAYREAFLLLVKAGVDAGAIEEFAYRSALGDDGTRRYAGDLGIEHIGRIVEFRLPGRPFDSNASAVVRDELVAANHWALSGTLVTELVLANYQPAGARNQDEQSIRLDPHTVVTVLS